MKKQTLKFNCNLQPIAMGELGEIGYYVKLEKTGPKKSMMMKRQKDRKSSNNPLFFFRFDEKQNKFYREISDKFEA